jgi:hypothetical protein
MKLQVVEDQSEQVQAQEGQRPLPLLCVAPVPVRIEVRDLEMVPLASGCYLLTG